MGKNGNYPAFDYSHIYSFVMGYLIDLLIIKKASPRCAKMLPVIRMGLTLSRITSSQSSLYATLFCEVDFW